MDSKIEFTPDGWIVEDLRSFRVLIDGPPPRPWGYLDQIRADVREPKVVGIWVAGLALVAAGAAFIAFAIAYSQWWLLLGGLLSLAGIRFFLLWLVLAAGPRSVRRPRRGSTKTTITAG